MRIRTQRGFFGICVGGGVFLDISNKKMYNINRVGENVTSIEEYDVVSINTSTYAVSGLTLVGTMHYSVANYFIK